MADADAAKDAAKMQKVAARCISVALDERERYIIVSYPPIPILHH